MALTIFSMAPTGRTATAGDDHERTRAYINCLVPSKDVATKTISIRIEPGGTYRASLVVEAVIA